jgi:hypothetical protein
MIDSTYDDFEVTLKDLLSWFQKAVTDYERDNVKRREHVASTGFMIPSVSTGSIDNARQAILNHCRAHDKKRKQQYGIL